MKIVRILLFLILAIGFIYPTLVIKYPQNTGKIINVSGIVNDPVPLRNYKIESRGQEIEAIAYENGNIYKVGDEVLLITHGEISEIADKIRITPIIRLAIIFTAVVLLISNTHGFNSIVGLVFSFGIIFNFLIPQILAGYNPLLVAISSSAVILFFSYLLTHGTSSKTYLAMVGTLLSLVLSGIMSMIFAKLMSLNGYASEEVMYLVGSIPEDSIYNLMLAGIMIGSLGVLDDITISQASIVSELKSANQKLGMLDLYKKAMNVGHDHISSLVNTLVLVYAGSSLPLLLLFVTSGASVGELISNQTVATEILRTLVGSIGLVMAVPFTTIISAYWYGYKH